MRLLEGSWASSDIPFHPTALLALPGFLSLPPRPVGVSVIALTHQRSGAYSRTEEDDVQPNLSNFSSMRSFAEPDAP